MSDGVLLNGIEYDSPLDRNPVPRRDYAEGRVSARISYKGVWIDRYVRKDGRMAEYWSCELRLLSNGKAFLDGVEIRNPREIAAVQEIFKGLQIA